MVNVQWSTLQQCLGAFTMLLVEGSSETGFLRHSYNYLFRSQSFRKYIAYEGDAYFWKSWKFNVNFRNAGKNWEKVFRFSDNSIWICWINLSLLTGKYLSSAVNVLTNSLKILYSTKIHFFQVNFFHSNQKIW